MRQEKPSQRGCTLKKQDKTRQEIAHACGEPLLSSPGVEARHVLVSGGEPSQGSKPGRCANSFTFDPTAEKPPLFSQKPKCAQTRNNRNEFPTCMLGGNHARIRVQSFLLCAPWRACNPHAMPMPGQANGLRPIRLRRVAHDLIASGRDLWDEL